MFETIENIVYEQHRKSLKVWSEKANFEILFTACLIYSVRTPACKK